MNPDISEIDGACHCGAVRFRVRLSDGLNTARRCNCSFCRMRGAVAVSAPLDGLSILQGGDDLVLYQFGTRQAEHNFCRHCGIYTHHRRRSNPNQLGVNIACLEGLSPFDFTELPVMEGVRHPKDGGGGIAGTLRYVPSA
ncbi:GFA family protein [Paracoccus zhejiangensis]|uniref:Aldehyde-activating protein n=1 Tax=Paracoccus zhejiangensis TaxID=1077935 RepID=A0A2H5EXR6_9RHOB|nr:GFA family protein [Paracoccus zhejiangensis]AUH64099.1 aldehyde-activating protein [Paracoccus zhejiangensis]